MFNLTCLIKLLRYWPMPFGAVVLLVVTAKSALLLSVLLGNKLIDWWIINNKYGKYINKWSTTAVSVCLWPLAAWSCTESSRVGWWLNEMRARDSSVCIDGADQTKMLAWGSIRRKTGRQCRIGGRGQARKPSRRPVCCIAHISSSFSYTIFVLISYHVIQFSHNYNGIS